MIKLYTNFVIISYGFKNWNAHFDIPTFDFMFKVSIPSSRKDREIVRRDMQGRILASRVT
jgi:hypothetical protein